MKSYKSISKIYKKNSDKKTECFYYFTNLDIIIKYDKIIISVGKK